MEKKKQEPKVTIVLLFLRAFFVVSLGIGFLGVATQDYFLLACATYLTLALIAIEVMRK